ncbi:MAG: AtpZ/AtpI family protein [Pseudomonadota bacterium]
MADDRLRDETSEASLRARIEAAQARHHKRSGRQADGSPRPEPQSGNALAVAFSISAQLVVAVGLGTWLGWQMDAWFGTRPLFLIVMMLLFTAAGFLNVFRGADRAHRQARQDEAEKR